MLIWDILLIASKRGNVNQFSKQNINYPKKKKRRRNWYTKNKDKQEQELNLWIQLMHSFQWIHSDRLVNRKKLCRQFVLNWDYFDMVDFASFLRKYINYLRHATYYMSIKTNIRILMYSLHSKENVSNFNSNINRL